MLLYSTMLDVNDTLTKEKFIQLVIKQNQESQREEREQAETEKEQVYSEFDDELKTLQERIDSLTQENETLRAENVGLHSKFGEMDKRLVLIMGDEEDLYQGVYRKKKAEIQRILKNYTIMDAKTQKDLQYFGFRIEEDGKHYRLTFFGDDRYKTTVAKAPPSDARWE